MNRIQQTQSPVPVRRSKSGRRITRLPLTLTLALLPTLLTGCQTKQEAEANATEVRSDGRFRWTLTRLKDVSPTQQFEWLDNETILLIGVDKAKRSGLFAWNRKDKARLLLPNAYRLCFDGETWRALVSKPDPISQTRSYIRYLINPKDLTATGIGTMASPEGGGYSNIYTCDEEPYLHELKGRSWIPLRPTDGYLDLGSDLRKEEEIALVKPHHQGRFPLGVKAKNTMTVTAQHSSYTNTYILYDIGFTLTDLQSWQASNKYTIYTLTTPTNVKPITIRSGPWSEVRGGDRAIEIAKHGLVISSKGGARTKPDSAGVYIIKSDNTFSKLDDDLIESPNISPNGCNLAYRRSTANQFDELRTINLCPPHN
jgi:hypothetical protein